MEWKKVREFILRIIATLLIGKLLLISGYIKVYLFDDSWFLIGLIMIQLVIELIAYMTRQKI